MPMQLNLKSSITVNIPGGRVEILTSEKNNQVLERIMSILKNITIQSDYEVAVISIKNTFLQIHGAYTVVFVNE